MAILLASACSTQPLALPTQGLVLELLIKGNRYLAFCPFRIEKKGLGIFDIK
jgi:hypothetical protein